MMGEGKEERKRDTLLYYIRGSLQERKERIYAAKGRERDISGRKRDVSGKKIAEGIGIWREIN
ncbi:hypothetical protein [Bacteroides fragilis]|uniref:hypothetical protein n=1 Tax=Bacteroides fragilis TaxID=817 RepID=UPI0012D2FD7B|nr:hypothetical protein [Bacteroides fragilis]